MLTKEDLGQIREVVRDEVTTSEKRVIKTIIEAVGQMIDDNILPQFDEIHVEIKEIKQDIGELKKDVNELKEDVSVLKQDVKILKQDVTVLKQDMTVVKQDVSEIKQDMRSTNAKMVTKGGLEDRLTDFRLSLSGTIA